MKRKAVVVERDGRLMAEVVRTEACQQCRACQFGQKDSVLLELPEGDYRVGDTVEITLNERSFTRATLLAYALPVATLLLALAAASLLGLSEGVQALCALGGLAAGLGVIKLLEPRLSALQPQARPCEKKEE